MTIEVRPLGIRCNLQCLYCYQTPQRDAGNFTPIYDLNVIKKAIEQENIHFSLFGGEAFLLPLEDLKELWAWGYEKFGHNGVQTNGSLITEEHIELFKKYNVNVGFSMDGPGELNDARWAGSLSQTRELTARSQAAFERVIAEKIPVSLITNLHRGNATQEKLPLLIDWIRELYGLGLRSVRLHILEVDSEEVRRTLALTDEENIVAFLALSQLEQELSGLSLGLFSELRDMLLGKDNCVTCTWTGCDPYTTQAVHGIEGDGQVSNCGRTNKDGVDFTKANQAGYERYLALYFTSQEWGGCRDCRFFLFCKGECPGTAIDGDWRNRSEHCQVWFALYEHIEECLLKEGEKPLSLSPRRQEIEQRFIELWGNGCRAYLTEVLQQLDNPAAVRSQTGFHGDYTDHGDSPHIDSDSR